MGLVGVISDPHANLPALEAVLAALESAAVDEVWCLGDLVGRGPHPQRVAELVRERCELVLAGNHDRVVCGRDPIWMLGGGRESAIARWTNAVMEQDTLRWLAGIPSTARLPGVAMHHGGPADAAWQFIGTRADAAAALAAGGEPLLLVGHTHQAAMFRSRGGALKDTTIRREATARLRDGDRAVLNPGSVGAGPAASFMLLDRDAGVVRWRSVAYDHAAVAADLQAAGFGTRSGRF